MGLGFRVGAKWMWEVPEMSGLFFGGYVYIGAFLES